MAKFFATMEMVLAQGVRILHSSYETGNKFRMNHGPGGMVLLGTGLVGLAGWGRKKFRK